MTMPCRISDENVFNPWEDDDDIIDESQDDLYLSESEDDMINEYPFGSLTLDNLSEFEHSVWIKPHPESGYTIEIQNDEETDLWKSTKVCESSMDSIASFCRKFLHSYTDILERELA